MEEINSSQNFWGKVRFRNWRIFTKLLVVLLALTLVPIVLVTYINSKTSAEALTEQELINLERLAYSTAQRINQLLADNHHFIRLAAASNEVDVFLENWQHDEAENSRPLVNQRIEDALNANDTINLVSVFDQNGVVAAHSSPQYIGQPYSFREYVSTALDGEEYISGILVGVTDNQPGLIGSAPVYRDSQVVGALSTRIKGHYIKDILTGTKQLEGVEYVGAKTSELDVYLVNAQNIIMSHADEDSDWLYQALGSISEEDLAEIQATKKLGGVCPGVQDNCNANDKVARTPDELKGLKPLADQILRAMEASQLGSAEYCRPEDLYKAQSNQDKCDGKKYIAAFSPVKNPVAEGNLFMVVIDQPQSVFLEEINALRTQGFAVALTTVVISVIIAIVVSRTMAKPISQLAQAAKDVEEDRPFEPEDIKEVRSLGDEIGHLARVFSNMVLALRARMAELRTIYEIGNKISESVELTETLSAIIQSLNNVIDFDAAEICIYDSNEDQLLLYVTNERIMSDDETVQKPTYSKQQGFFSHLFKYREAILVSNIDEAKGSLTSERSWSLIEPKSYLGIALRDKGQVVGTIEMVNKQADNFDENNKRVLESISLQAAVAIRNAREVKERERRLKNMEIVVDESKVEEQVEAITNRGIFKDIQAIKRSEKDKGGD